MRFKTILSLTCALMLAATSQAQQWDKYVPEKQRKEIFKRSAKATGMGAAMSGQIAIALWITEPMARVLVSQAIDKERLAPGEADAMYRELRPEGGVVFLIDARRVAASPFGTSVQSLPDPLARKELFLQRAEDRKVFSKGEVSDHDFDIHLPGLIRGNELISTYYVNFPRADRSGQPIIRDLADKIEIQFVISSKKVVLDYKIKDLVARLEDL